MAGNGRYPRSALRIGRVVLGVNSGRFVEDGATSAPIGDEVVGMVHVPRRCCL